MNYDRIYQYRFQDISADKKKVTWEEIAGFIYKKLSNPVSRINNAIKSEDR